MLDAVIAIFFLFIANLTITVARTKLIGLRRRAFSTLAFLLLIPAFLFAVRAVL